MNPRRHMKKMRADSTFTRLTPEQREEVDEMLLSGTGYAEVKAWLAERGLHCSATSVADYYQNHVVPARWARVNRRVKQAGKLEAAGADEMTLNELRTLVLEMTLNPAADLKSIKTLYGLVIKGRQLELDARRIAMLEKKAEQAAAAENVAKDAAATAEEKEQRIKQIFGIA